MIHICKTNTKEDFADRESDSPPSEICILKI